MIRIFYNFKKSSNTIAQCYHLEVSQLALKAACVILTDSGIEIVKINGYDELGNITHIVGVLANRFPQEYADIFSEHFNLDWVDLSLPTLEDICNACLI